MSDVFRSSAVNFVQRKFHSAKSLLPSQPPGNAPLEYSATNSCHVMPYCFSNSRTLLRKKSALTRFMVSIASLLRYRSRTGPPFPAPNVHSLDVRDHPLYTLTREYYEHFWYRNHIGVSPYFSISFHRNVPNRPRRGQKLG